MRPLREPFCTMDQANSASASEENDGALFVMADRLLEQRQRHDAGKSEELSPLVSIREGAKAVLVRPQLRLVSGEKGVNGKCRDAEHSSGEHAG